MAKQPKTETNAPKVPNAELVGDHAKISTVDADRIAGADSGAASVPATAAGGATAPVATNSTDTTASGSGDAAGTVTTDLVKPQEGTGPTTAIPAGAEQGASNPEAEASASGINSSGDIVVNMNTSSPGDNEKVAAAVASGLSAVAADAIISKVLGVEPPEEKREFVLVFGPIRHNNIRYKSGKRIVLTRDEHAELRKKQRVVEWDKGEIVA
ncbi:hypothetical protein BG46_01435 [Brucella anthropi]|uniref:hypothetical protein n=1 Tax=Brucella anthropi TaxID=529 RepID=UPI0004537D78|nr:hypothetical protein [Brucella anthropi]EXL08573.1 hypothetical protein BG46_01435 [Brucella anthropi]